MSALVDLTEHKGMIANKLAEKEQRILDDYLSKNPTADKSVMGFIIGFTCRFDSDYKNNIEYSFSSGYCMYFAIMLKFAMGRGHLYIAAPIDHIVWGDEDGQYYDVKGLYKDFCTEYIPIEGTILDGHQSYKHVPYVYFEDNPMWYYDRFIEIHSKNPETLDYLNKW